MSGIDLGQCDYDGRTPLHVAATHGRSCDIDTPLSLSYSTIASLPALLVIIIINVLS